MNIPSHLKFSKTDEWFDPSTGAIGLTDFAQSQLSDMVYVEIQVEPGESMEPGKAIASVESVKASAETYSPVSGRVSEVNKALSDTPETLNKDPYVAGWMVKVDGAVPGPDLMDAVSYEKYCTDRAQK